MSDSHDKYICEQCLYSVGTSRLVWEDARSQEVVPFTFNDALEAVLAHIRPEALNMSEWERDEVLTALMVLRRNIHNERLFRPSELTHCQHCQQYGVTLLSEQDLEDKLEDEAEQYRYESGWKLPT